MWEIAIKGATGKLHFFRPIVAAVLALGFGILPVAGAPAEHAGGLPPYHNDPFGRLIRNHGRASMPCEPSRQP